MGILIGLIIFIGISIFINTHSKSKSILNALEITTYNRFTSIFVLVFVYSGVVGILGYSGLTYRLGFSGLWTAIITSTIGYMPLLFLGKRYAQTYFKYKAQHKAKNVISLVNAKYDSILTSILVGSLHIMLSFVLIIIQLVGAKYVLDVANNNYHNYYFMAYVALICILFVCNGVRPLSLMNSLVGGLSFLMSFFLLFKLIHLGGGLETIKHHLMLMNPEYFSPLGLSKYQISYMFIFSYWIYLGFGVLGVPAISFRAVNYSKFSKTAMLGGTLVIFFIGFNMGLVGLLTIPLLGSGIQGDRTVPIIIKLFTSNITSDFLLLIILLTCIGGVKVQLIAIQNIVESFISSAFNFRERSYLVLQRVIIVVIILIASYFAINYELNLFSILMFAIGGFASAFTWTIVFIPYNHKFVNKGAAIASIIFGSVLYSFIYNSTTNWRAFFYPATLPVVLGLAVYIIFGYVYYFFTRVFYKIIT